MWESRIARLFQILARISPHSYATVQDLAKEFEVTEKTIQRDIQTLQDAKLGVFVDDENRVRISRQGMRIIKHWMSS